MAQAHAMVWKYGMGPSGMIGDYEVLSGAGMFRGESHEGKLADAVKEKLNLETQQVLQECLKEVEHLLKKEESLLDRFAKELQEKEEVEYDEIEKIMKENGKGK